MTYPPAFHGDVPPTDGRTLALVAVGGALGTIVRYEVGLTVHSRSGAFPTSTLVINVAGALLLGLLLGAVARHRPSDHTLRPLLGVGVLGGFTTFSTFAVETVQLARSDHALSAAAYVVASIGLGLAAARTGELLMRVAPILVPEDEA